MRYFVHPAPITIKIPTPPGEKPVTREEHFASFMTDNVVPLVGKTLKEIRQQNRIVDQVEKTQPGDVIALDSADWEKMVEAMKKGEWTPIVARQILRFFDAIEQATEEDPTAKNNSKAASEKSPKLAKAPEAVA